MTLMFQGVDKGAWSRETGRSLFSTRRFPKDEAERVQREAAIFGGPLMLKAQLRAWQQSFPDDWKQMIAGVQPFEQLAQADEMAAQNGNGQPPQLPMPPGMGPEGIPSMGAPQGAAPAMPGGLAATPGGMPPGPMPPQLPPPGGPGLPPGLPPELASLPPEILQQVVQALQQGIPLEAIMQALMGGPPPGSGGMQPPGLPGIPQEMTGGIPPEMMGLGGLPPGMAPEMYAQLTNQPPPTPEEILRSQGALPPQGGI
jgi:hypothetical protein